MQPGMTPTLSSEIDSACKSRRDTGENATRSDLTLVDAAVSELRLRLGTKRYALWFDGKIGLAIHDDLLTVSVGSPFLLNWMQKQFKEVTLEAARSVLGHSARVVFSVDANLSVGRAGGMKSTSDHGSVIAVESIAAVEPQGHSSVARAISTSDAIVSYEQRMTVGTRVSSQGLSKQTAGLGQSYGRRLAELNDFIPGPQTELALTAARQIATGQQTQFNPLYIHGTVGAGKTHLLEGICRQLKRTQPTANVMLITSEAFANYFTQALRDRTLPSFRQRFRGLDALLVDDIEFFESKRVFQEEFLHTFAELVDHGRQVVLTGSRHPRLLTKLGDELATRFLSGLVCRLDIPDSVTRQKIVDSKAARLTGQFSPEALQYVAQRFQNSVRELEGALHCLQTLYSMTKKPVTLSAARQVLADLERDCLRIVRLADVVRVVCGLFGVKPKDLESESRVRTVSQPRMLAMFLARKHTESAYSEIGQQFGGRNHSTVMSAERKVQQWLDENSTIQVASQKWSIGEILSTLEQQLLAG
mgnify:CR=1 FL=1